MARMHSRKKGQAGSSKPLKPSKPTWTRYSEKELEILIAKIAKEGKSASEIGLALRDTYGIPSIKALTGKTIKQILDEKKLLPDLPWDLHSLIKRAVIIRKHLEENHKDTTALRGLQLTESKIKRLAKYYKKSGVLPLTWKYDPKAVKLYV